MSSIDPGKLKVVELRAELTSRGLESKGNKPVLVKRLKEALQKELKQDIPDTSIADTSTEDLNLSQEDVEAEQPVKKEEDESPPLVESVDEKPEVDIKIKLEDIKKEEHAAEDDHVNTNKEIKEEPPEEESKQPDDKAVVKMECDSQSDDIKEVKDDEPVEPEPVAENGKTIIDIIDQQVNREVPEEKSEKTSDPKLESRGEKRRRSSPLPERVQRRRSKSPIREDEPSLDNNKVQLSWYDSDLHLQLDKKSFLSGKPYHEGAFGYAWAGVKATHGAKTGKVCFEVKITEELKWEDPVKLSDKKREVYRRDRSKPTRKDRRSHSRSRQDSDFKPKSDESIETGNQERAVPEKMEMEETSQTKEAEQNEPEKMEIEQKEPEKMEIEQKEPEIVELKQKETDNLEPKQKETDNVEPKQKETEKVEPEQEETKKVESKQKEPDKEPQQKEPEKKGSKQKELDKVEPEQKEQEKKESEQKEPERKDSEEEPVVEEKKDKETTEPEEPVVEPIAKHLLRVGWSTLDISLQLGESDCSFGFESSAKFVSKKNFVDYGVKYGVGDVIGAYLNIDEETATMNFTVNGQVQPEACAIPRTELPSENFAMFPHMLSRNYTFEANFGDSETAWFPHPPEFADYVYLVNVDDKLQGPSRPETRSDCEVIMMCGLPASGKTHWVRQFTQDNLDKKYTVIGNSHLLERMTVNGNPLKNSYKGRWNVILDKLMKCVNILVEAAALRRRNFIIDQTNVFPSAQRRKMRLFEGFKRRAVVLVVADEEQAKRRALQEAQDGKDVPDSAILEMKANMNLPRRGDWLEEVTFVELDEAESKAMIQKYNHQGREAGFGSLSPKGGQRSGYRDNRGHPYRWDHSTSRRDYRGSYRDNRSYNNRYDRSRHNNWQNCRPPPGSWNRDVRRDNRGGSSGSSREYRINVRSSGSGNRQERSGNRDNRNRSQSSNNYNRNQRPQGGNRSQSSSNWQDTNQGNWGSGQSMWNQGNWSQQGSWGGQPQQWKGNYGQSGYGQGQGYGNYAGWNYYGQYQQHWNSQGQPQTTTAGGLATPPTTTAYNNQYSQQTGWTQYTQQYTGDQATTHQQSIQN